MLWGHTVGARSLQSLEVLLEVVKGQWRFSEQRTGKRESAGGVNSGVRLLVWLECSPYGTMVQHESREAGPLASPWEPQ